MGDLKRAKLQQCVGSIKSNFEMDSTGKSAKEPSRSMSSTARGGTSGKPISSKTDKSKIAVHKVEQSKKAVKTQADERSVSKSSVGKLNEAKLAVQSGKSGKQNSSNSKKSVDAKSRERLNIKSRSDTSHKSVVHTCGKSSKQSKQSSRDKSSSSRKSTSSRKRKRSSERSFKTSDHRPVGAWWNPNQQYDIVNGHIVARQPQSSKFQTCKTCCPKCLALMLIMLVAWIGYGLYSANRWYEPCDDFYEHTCRNYRWILDKHDAVIFFQVPEKLDQAKHFRDSILKGIDLYEAQRKYANSGTVSSLLALLIEYENEKNPQRHVGKIKQQIAKMLGGDQWPLLSGSKATEQDWMDAFVDLYFDAGEQWTRGMLFRLNPVSIGTGTHRIEISVFNHWIGLPTSNEELANYMIDRMQLDSRSFQVFEELADLQKYLNVQFKIKVAESRELTFDQFESEFKFDLKRLYSKLETRAGVQTSANFEKIVLIGGSCIDCLKGLIRALFGANSSPKLWKNLFGLLYAQISLYNLNSANSKSETNTWNKPMVGALNRIYLDGRGSSGSNLDQLAAIKKKVTDMVAHLKTVFRKQMQKADWLDEATRNEAIKKLNNIGEVIAYEDFWLDDEKFDRFTNMSKDNKLAVPGDLYSSILNVNQHNARWTIQFVANPKIFTDNLLVIINFGITNHDVNAFYSPLWNCIIIPLGLLQYPFFDLKAPDAVLYGSIGFILGHELTHSVDSSGRLFDQNGFPRNWWSKSSEENFNQRSSCLIDQYSSIRDWRTFMKLDGNKTLGEDIADNGGVKEAYWAWASHQQHARIIMDPAEYKLYTPEQLFFYSNALPWCENMGLLMVMGVQLEDVHTLAKYRVNVPMSNFDQFAKAFNCEKGSNMNPEKKCSVW